MLYNNTNSDSESSVKTFPAKKTSWTKNYSFMLFIVLNSNFIVRPHNLIRFACKITKRWHLCFTSWMWKRNYTICLIQKMADRTKSVFVSFITTLLISLHHSLLGDKQNNSHNMQDMAQKTWISSLGHVVHSGDHCPAHLYFSSFFPSFDLIVEGKQHCR